MTMTSSKTSVFYEPDGVQTLFPFPVPVFHAGDVYAALAEGYTETPLTGFAVEGLGTDAGVHVRFTVPPPAGKRLVLYRWTRRVQESDYPEGGRFPAKVVETDFDRGIAMHQEVAEKLTWAVSVPRDGDMTPGEFVASFFQAADAAQAAAAEAGAQAAGSAGSAAKSAASAREAEAAAGDAWDAAGNATNMAVLAKAWAENPENTPVDGDGYSAKHWALKAAEAGSEGPVASPAQKGFVPAGGKIGTFYGVSDDGTAYGFHDVPLATTARRGMGRTATDEEAASGVTGENGPAWVTPEQLRVASHAVTQHKKEIMAASGTFVTTTTGWYDITLVGAGGAGGTSKGNGGGAGGDTTLAVNGTSYTAQGGSGGGAGGGGSGSGSGGPGQVVKVRLFLREDTTLTFGIGAGGATNSASGTDGEGPYGGEGYVNRTAGTQNAQSGGGGARGGQPGQGNEIAYAASNNWGGNGANGGSNGTGYGGGGGGGAGVGGSMTALAGRGADNGDDALVEQGGAGGAGAAFIEYDDVEA